MGKISSLIGKEFDNESVYGGNDKYIKAKIKSNGYNKNKHFQSKKVTKENVSYKCLAMVVIDSVIRVNKTILGECKYEIKKNKMENLINNDLDSSSSHEPDNESDNESEKLSKKPNKIPYKKSDNDKFESD